MSSAKRSGTPSTDLLTTAEAAKYLRLTDSGIKHPDISLHRYRKLGRLQGVRVGRNFLWYRSSLDEFLAAGKSS